GISTRLIGAVVMVHGDNKGLVLPPKVAPVQAVVVPIPYKNTDSAKVITKAKEVFENLKAKNIRVVLDDREEYTPGWKFNHWELKGVPVRVEIGPRDLRQQQVTLARRDTHEKTAKAENEAVAAIIDLLDEIQKSLYDRAKKKLEERITAAANYEGFKKALKNKKGFIKASWCGNPECEEKIKEETGATIRLKPLEKEEEGTKCICCGEKAEGVVFFARSY
ncbi:proline--tRNA ligase, partial [Candidatus Bathyarchaeota archaeon]|nr:proline--tRNA ligase [Candidatus Bathyarchaeota archaeon]